MIQHVLGSLAALSFTATVAASDTDITPAQQADVVSALRSLVVTELFDPALAPSYEAALDGFELVSAPVDDFALRLHRAMQAVAQDGHFGVYGPQRARRLFGDPMHSGHEGGHAGEGSHGDASHPTAPTWFDMSEPVPGSLLVRMSSFPSGEAAETLIAALVDHDNLARLVLDLRGNGGGDARTFRLLANCLFAEPQPLYAIRWRRGEGFHTDTHSVEPDPRCADINTVPMLILIDARTASVGELMPFVFQRRGRAIVAGEASWGASHAAELYRLPHGLAAMLPIGVTHDPVDGADWEQLGVQPDLVISSEE